MHITRLAPAAVALAVATTVAAPAFAGGKTVRVTDNRFRSQTVHVAVGGTVTWKWVGADAHNVTFKRFHSKTQHSGTFKHRFTKRGTYRYVCTLHRDVGMKGTVVVG